MVKHVVYIGSYTEVLGHVPYGKGRGIELFEFDSDNGTLTPLKVQVFIIFHSTFILIQ